MKVAVVGAGHVGANIARRLADAGHHVSVCFTRDLGALEALADDLRATSVADPAHAVADAEVVVVSVPWSALPDALDVVGPLTDKIVIDTTNQFGHGPGPAPGQTAAGFNAARMSGARYTKSFNTLTAGFQAQVAHRDPRVVQWLCGDDLGAKDVVAGLIRDAGYEPVDLGGTATCGLMEAPRRPGAVYGEEYRLADAARVVDAVAMGVPIPLTPTYQDA